MNANANANANANGGLFDDMPGMLTLFDPPVNPDEDFSHMEPQEDRYQNRYAVIVECDGEFHQQALYEALKGEGLSVKVVVI